jgi:hypothetical protein
MKKFLLTWYGITDFRASLGFENTDGPIVGALAAEDYSDVVILGYTRADNDSNECVENQKFFVDELASICNAGQEKDWKTTGAFVSKFANTTIAHEYFINWLKAKVHDAGDSTKIQLKSEKLRELNDTEGIYACAMRALDWVEQEPGEKLVTLYLSPGTPVMAFVWAFAALGHPELKKRLIASSVIGKSPETISLPAEWLERHGVKQQALRNAADGFDVTFHLFGEQRMPALLSIRQFESEHHIFVNSKDYPATCMQAFLGARELLELYIDPWDDRAVHERITELAKQFPENTRIGINLTGGTKLMFAGALAAARELGAVPFYFDSRNRRVTFIDSLCREKIRPIDSVETFLQLNGDGLKLSNNGVMDELSPDRRYLTETLWKLRGKIADRYKELCKINDDHEKLRKRNADITPFKVECNALVFELDRNQVATVVGGGLNLRFENWPDFAKYLSGGWFEEYVYVQCKQYEDSGVIKDLRINVKLQLDQGSSGISPHWDAEYNELDVVFTDGHALYIVECKAGKVTQEQVMKLQNLVRFYGGVEGRGIVACCFKPSSKSVQKKIKDARQTLCCDESFSEQLKALMNGIAKRAQSIGEST